MMNWDLEISEPQPVQKRLFAALEDVEERIYNYLLAGGKQQLDAIAISCQIPVFEVSSTLVSMEMKGVVRCLPGKEFEAV